jgi:hypothetical protein
LKNKMSEKMLNYKEQIEMIEKMYSVGHDLALILHQATGRCYSSEPRVPKEGILLLPDGTSQWVRWGGPENGRDSRVPFAQFMAMAAVAWSARAGAVIAEVPLLPEMVPPGEPVSAKVQDGVVICVQGRGNEGVDVFMRLRGGKVCPPPMLKNGGPLFFGRFIRSDAPTPEQRAAAQALTSRMDEQDLGQIAAYNSEATPPQW